MRSVLFTLLIAIANWASEAAPPHSFLLGGIQVNEPDHDYWMESLKANGFNSVSITVYAKQGNWDSDHFWFEDDEPSVLEEIRSARKAGLSVVLIPRVALDHSFPANDQLWHGMIMPTGEAALRSWFEKYRRFLLKWAEVAEQEKVDIYAVGSELKSLTATLPVSARELNNEIEAFAFWYGRLPGRAEASDAPAERKETYRQWARARSQAYLKWGDTYYGPSGADRFQSWEARRMILEDEWKKSIRSVRSKYSGPLTYAANFDAYERNGLWKDLNIIGINAYFKHRQSLGSVSTERLRGQLDASWDSIFRTINHFRVENGLTDKPVLFTEIGFTGRRHATVEPWSYSGQSVVEWLGRMHLVDWEAQPPDARERTEALAALRRTIIKPENAFFRGLLYWKLSTDPRHREIEPFVVHIASGSNDPALPILRLMAPVR